MADEPRPRPATEPVEPEGSTPVRFEATVHPAAADAAAEMSRVADLDLDRVPDPEGRIRVLVNAGDVARLLRQGFEVHLHREVPVRPLDARLVADDAEVRTWFDEQVSGAHEAGSS